MVVEQPAPTTMVHARPQTLVEALRGDGDARLQALRAVKNQVIGNKQKKLAYIQLGAVPQLLAIVSSATDPTVVVQASVALGSLACETDDAVREILKHGGVEPLVRALCSEDEAVVTAGARALKLVCQVGGAPPPRGEGEGGSTARLPEGGAAAGGSPGAGWAARAHGAHAAAALPG